jgi:GEVED domain/Secretion system C-terminal sorting domain
MNKIYDSMSRNFESSYTVLSNSAEITKSTPRFLTRIKLFAVFAAMLSLSPQISAQYCNATYNSLCSSADYINNFSTSGGVANITNNNSGCNGNADNYIFYNTFTCSQMQGQNITLNMQCGPSWAQGFGVWIDWNADLDFGDVGEDVYFAPSGFSLNTVTIAVPIGAVPGPTRMRVMCQYATTPISSDYCASGLSFGEVEDYVFDVIAAAACSGQPVAGSATVSDPTPCPSTAISFGLLGATNASGLTYQWQYSASGTGYTNIPSANSASYPTTATNNGFYRCVITCTSSGLSDTTTPVQITIGNFLNCYCVSTATTPFDEEIFNVTLGTLNNTSTCTSTGGPGSVASQYSNFTALTPPDLAQGVVYPMSVQTGECNFGWINVTKVWIDYNQNGLFTDPGEEVYSPINFTAGPHTDNFSFTVPLTATVGITRMRVVLMQTWDPSQVTPCASYFAGETEDYFVNIAPIPTCPQPTASQVLSTTTTSVNLDWTPGGAETAWQVQYGAQGFSLGTGTIISVSTNSNLTIPGLAPFSFYQAYIRAVCGPGDTSFWAPAVSWNTYGIPQYMETSTECPAAGFIDISNTGNDLFLSDDSNVGFVLPFPILMQGVLYNNITVGNNGGVQLGSTTAFIGYGGDFNTMPSGTMFPWGDDLDDETGNVYTEEIGTAPNRIFIVQWDSSCNFSGFVGAPNVTFQMQIHEADMNIYYVYDDAVFGGSDVFDDYAANADIGLSGVTQDFTISSGNQTYLQNNSCVRFYYVDCPKIDDLTMDYVLADEASLSWTPGLGGASSWLCIYGPSGFNPLTSGTSVITTSPSSNVLTGLAQNTLYDVYVYSLCSSTSQSVGELITFNTLPFCSNPTAIVTGTAIDSVFTEWNWTTYSGGAYPATGFNLQYGSVGFSNGTGTVIANSDLTAPYNDTTFNAAFLSGGVYDIYVQAVCGTDTSSYIGPFVFTMPLTNDIICGAEMLPVDGVVRTFSNVGATVEINENAIAPPATGAQTTDGWINSNVDFTTWFTFVAPATGDIRISGVDVGFNGQMAVYSAASCSPITSLVLEAANDNEIDGTSLAPNFTVCGLTPGVTYFLMHDSFSTVSTGIYSIKMSQISLDAGNNGALINACLGDTVDLFTGITGQQAGGTWLDTDGTFHIVGGTMFNTGGLAAGTYDFEYRLEDGCAYDSSMASVQIYPPSSAGTPGTINICKNEPTNLFNGLSGNADLGGTWTNPNGVALPDADITWGTLSVPGNYNYTYTVGNGVCPDVSSIVTIIVNPICDWLGIENLDLSGIKFFPNPTNDVMNIEAESLTEDLNLELTDMNGKVLWTGSMSVGVKSVQVDVSTFERGVYLLKLGNSKSENTVRVVKN